MIRYMHYPNRLLFPARQKFTFLIFFILIILFSGCHPDINPPVAPRIKKDLVTNGHTRVDSYYWLNQPGNPAVLRYLQAENAYTEIMMRDTRSLQDTLFREITGRLRPNDSTVPYFDNGYFYYSRYNRGQEYPLYCRKKGSLEAPEEVMLNVNDLAKGKSFCQVAALNVSPDNRILAYGLDTVSRRKYTIYFKNLETGQNIDIPIPRTIGQVAWANDSHTVFYTLVDDTTLRSYKVCRHVLGTSPDKDVAIYTENDPTFSIGAYKSKSEKYVMIACLSYTANEYLYIDADKPMESYRSVLPREKNHEYSVDHMGKSFYILTNWNAPNFRLMETPVGSKSKSQWKELIPHRKNVLLQNFELFDDYLVLDERRDGLNYLRVINRHNRKEHYINFGEETYTASISVNPGFHTKWLRYEYTSLTTPASVYDYNMETMEKKLLKRDEVLGGFDPSDYEAKRLWAMAPDSTMVPISLVYRKGLRLNGRNPLLLYGYGAYGLSEEPDFRPERLSLLNRGFVYAIAHVRGGEDMGREWYTNGKLLHKKNTFTDYIACAEYLIAQKYTDTANLFAMGASAGGLLMGAVVNLRPGLFKGVIAAVPFVDVLTTMLDETLPLTTGEYEEWGNPKEKLYYNYILSYSPYDNVEAKAYPAMLVLGSLHDSQVQYWEPAKWVAKLRYMKTDHHMLLLKMNLEAGHHGSSGRYQHYKDTALEYAFMFKLLGITH